MDRMPVNFREVLVCNTPSSLGRYDTFHTTWCDKLVNLLKYDLNNMKLSHVDAIFRFSVQGYATKAWRGVALHLARLSYRPVERCVHVVHGVPK